MERKQKPVIVVDERRLDLVLDLVGLAIELRAHVTHLDRLAFFIRALVRNLTGLRLPLPFVGNFEESGDFPFHV